MTAPVKYCDYCGHLDVLPPVSAQPALVEGAAGALGAAEDGRAADGLAAHGAGKGAVEQRVAAGGGRRGRWHVVLRLRHGLMTV